MHTQNRESLLQRRMSRRFQFSLVFEGAAVGLLAGGVVCAYRLSLHYAEHALTFITRAAAHSPIYVFGWILMTLVIMFVVGKLVVWEPYTAGSGIPQIDAEVAGHIDMPWYRVMAAKFVEGTLCTLAGLSLGREGPAVQLGGMSGKAVSKCLGKEKGEERILVTCGAGAGMAAAFHAPLTGLMFTLEEIHKVFNAPLIISVTISCVVADYLVAQVLGIAPVLAFQFALDLPHKSYPLIILMGIALGGLGALHNKGMFLSQSLYSRINSHLPYGRYIIPFLLSGIVVFRFPELICGGDAIIELMEGFTPKPIDLLIFLLIGKYIFTTICFGSGAPGGTLFPLVVMGALSGAIFGNIAVEVVGLNTNYVTNFMVLGITGLFAGVVRAPVTGIMLAFELTGTLDSMLAAALVAIIAYVTANLCGVEPFYEKLLADYLGHACHDEIADECSEKIIHTHIVEPGSYLEDKCIGSITWPDSMLVVTVNRSGVEIIARGDTKLQAMDKLLVIMNLDEEAACEKRVRSLCRGYAIECPVHNT